MINLVFCKGQSKNHLLVVFQTLESVPESLLQFFQYPLVHQGFQWHKQFHLIGLRLFAYIWAYPTYCIPSLQDFVSATACFVCRPKHHKHSLKVCISANTLSTIVKLHRRHQHCTGVGEQQIMRIAIYQQRGFLAIISVDTKIRQSLTERFMCQGLVYALVVLKSERRWYNLL